MRNVVSKIKHIGPSSPIAHCPYLLEHIPWKLFRLLYIDFSNILFFFLISFSPVFLLIYSIIPSFYCLFSPSLSLSFFFVLLVLDTPWFLYPVITTKVIFLFCFLFPSCYLQIASLLYRSEWKSMY